jgi:hypothetical protein
MDDTVIYERIADEFIAISCDVKRLIAERKAIFDKLRSNELALVSKIHNGCNVFDKLKMTKKTDYPEAKNESL